MADEGRWLMMSVERQIQIAVAKTDLLITSGMRFLKLALPVFIGLALFFYALNRADWR